MNGPMNGPVDQMCEWNPVVRVRDDEGKTMRYVKALIILVVVVIVACGRGARV